MARTFVGVQLENAEAEQAFSLAMGVRGFIRTVTSKLKRRALRLPAGMYLIDRAGPVEALELTRDAARETNVRARIFCLPVDGDIRFANLQRGATSGKPRRARAARRR